MLRAIARVHDTGYLVLGLMGCTSFAKKKDAAWARGLSLRTVPVFWTTLPSPSPIPYSARSTEIDKSHCRIPTTVASTIHLGAPAIFFVADSP
jgi:hypothetical protein